MTFSRLLGGVAAVAIIATAAQAQVTTGNVRGTVTDANGAPVAGASITVLDTRTNTVSQAVTDAQGGFGARNLRPGGPYNVLVTSDAFAPEQLEGVFVELGDTTRLSIALEAGGAEREVIVVRGAALDAVQVATGPAATFTLEDLQSLPSVNRTINDVIRTDPRIYVNEADVDGIQCAGANSRFNSLTLDGVRLNDGFGLNRNGFPTERQPFSFDAIQQVAVELAPFDVFYGGFSACNINAVTKSGANEFFGGAFYDYTSDALRGDSREGQSINLAEFDEVRYGFNVGGPIVKDKLFFFAAYEKLEGANTFDRGFEGSGALNIVDGFTEAEFNEIRQIAIDLYDYDPGGLPSSFDNEDEKLLVRFDWDITNNHRANFTYTYNDGFNTTESDGDSDEFEFSNHLYERGAELNSYVGSVFSDWTDSFSTEFRLGFTELDNRQDSIGNDGFGEFRINDDDGNTIYIGEDDSRQSNDLNYEVFNFVARGNYAWNNHSISFGWEREELELFNLFVQHTIGQFDFFNDFDDDGNLTQSGIEKFRLGLVDNIDYNNAPSLDPTDAAADWGYAIDTLYVQDTWQVSPTFELTYGVRYDYYTSDDVPAENPNFVESYGFSNAITVDGEGLLQPRIGFSWDAKDNLTVRGGLGLFSGGNPNVWLSNNFSNDFVSQFGADEDEFFDAGFTSLFDDGVVYPDGPGPGYSVPSQLIDLVASGTGSTGFEMNNLDPDFKIPAEWKLALGATYDINVPMANFLGGDYTINADLLFTQDKDAATVIRGDFVEADPVLNGLLPQYSSPFSPNTLTLTNTDENAESLTLSFTVSKEYDFGLDWTFGYAYNDAEDVNPMTSSVAFSNYTSPAFVDPNNPGVATSNYNIENRFTLVANYSRAFFGDYETRIGAFAVASEGRPFSYTMNSRGGGDISNFNPFLRGDNYLLYVPTGVDDPNVDLSAIDTTEFFDFINSSGLSDYAGGFAERNAFEGDWWAKVDLRLEQEFPGLMDGHKTAGFIVIDNFTNMLNDEWGILREASFPRRNSVVDARLNGDDTQLIYSNFDPETPSVVGDASLWQVRVGVRYEF